MIKNVYWSRFPLQSSSETFRILRRNERDMIKIHIDLDLLYTLRLKHFLFQEEMSEV
jgi:hypothetical protein